MSSTILEILCAEIHNNGIRDADDVDGGDDDDGQPKDSIIDDDINEDCLIGDHHRSDCLIEESNNEDSLMMMVLMDSQRSLNVKVHNKGIRIVGATMTKSVFGSAMSESLLLGSPT